MPDIPRRDDPANDDFLFDQGPTRGLSKIRFHDYGPVFDRFDLPNVRVFQEQIEVFKTMLVAARPDLVRVAANQEFAGADTPLKAGDEVALCPPVTGGSGQGR